MSNMGAALLRHGRIQTTLPKAKALRPFIEKIITLAKKAEGASPEKALHYRRLALSRVRDKEAVATLFNERASEFTKREGGYTRIYKLGNRIGDAAEMAVIQLIAAEDEARRARVQPRRRKLLPQLKRLQRKL
jgi:large subunit ribosomal protein L17